MFVHWPSTSLVEFEGPEAQERSRHAQARVAGVELVAGELFGDETVVGRVGVERVDHPVAIAPGLGAMRVGLVAVGLGVPHQVEPMASPALAVARRGQ